jgi:hypothetical protein
LRLEPARVPRGIDPRAAPAAGSDSGAAGTGAVPADRRRYFLECRAFRNPRTRQSSGTLIGEPAGNSPSFNASEIHLDLPHLSYFLNLSTARMIRPDVNAGPAEAILPEVLAPMTAEALAPGTDPALEFVRSRP